MKILNITGKIVLSICGCMLAMASVSAASEASNEDLSWLKLYFKQQGLNRINANLTAEVDSVYYSEVEVTTDNETSFVTMINVATPNGTFTLPLDSIESMMLGSNIPTLYIDTDPYVDEITSKVDYLTATIRYEPYGDGSEAFEGIVSIRGRGNTSWYFPKKPYRLKFEKKQALAGLPKAKSFVLLSNYIDNTLMRNAIAMKIAQMLELPYTNEIVPVNLVFNGKQRGNYMLTNKLGINSGSLDIDEKEGILWEIDTNFDEEFKFRSETFDLPCMVSDPDFHEITKDDPEEIEALWTFWRQDLEAAFKAVEEGRWQDVFDAEQFVKYMIVQDIVLNGELGWPKSTFLYKENKDGKYKFGPIWDFDWAFNYTFLADYGIMDFTAPAYQFFINIFTDEAFLEMFEAEFNRFCDSHLDDLMQYIDDYAALIRDSAMADAMIWPAEHHNTANERKERNASRFDENIDEMKEWILKRIELIKSSPEFKLYE